MSEINIHNPSDGSDNIDVESVFLGMAAKLQPEMDREQQERFQAAERMAEVVVDGVESHLENVQSAKLIAVAGLTFVLGLLAGRK